MAERGLGKLLHNILPGYCGPVGILLVNLNNIFNTHFQGPKQRGSTVVVKLNLFYRDNTYTTCILFSHALCSHYACKLHVYLEYTQTEQLNFNYISYERSCLFTSFRSLAYCQECMPYRALYKGCSPMCL